jgi:hypothetical protein
LFDHLRGVLVLVLESHQLLQLLVLCVDYRAENVFVLDPPLLLSLHVLFDLPHVELLSALKFQQLETLPFFSKLMCFFPKNLPFLVASCNSADVSGNDTKYFMKYVTFLMNSNEKKHVYIHREEIRKHFDSVIS